MCSPHTAQMAAPFPPAFVLSFQWPTHIGDGQTTIRRSGRARRIRQPGSTRPSGTHRASDLGRAITISHAAKRCCGPILWVLSSSFSLRLPFLLIHLSSSICASAPEAGVSTCLESKTITTLLSVDIDLTYVPVADRATSLKAIDAGMKWIADAITKGNMGMRSLVSTRPGFPLCFKAHPIFSRYCQEGRRPPSRAIHLALQAGQNFVRFWSAPPNESGRKVTKRHENQRKRHTC